MSISLPLEQLLAYSEHERRKWRGWFAADPARLAIPFQRDGRFPTVGDLLDHVFLVERRHLSRLEGGTPPERTGLAPADATALFEYADLVRGDLGRYLADLDEELGTEVLSFAVRTGTLTTSRHKLAVHILLHEIRHFAQMAYAARVAGHEPPGEHDYLFGPDPGGPAAP